MSPAQIKLAVAGALALVAWLFGGKASAAAAAASPGRLTSTLEIDANVYSPTFGQPIADVGDDPVAVNTNPPPDSEMHRLIEESNAWIAAN